MRNYLYLNEFYNDENYFQYCLLMCFWFFFVEKNIWLTKIETENIISIFPFLIC